MKDVITAIVVASATLLSPAGLRADTQDQPTIHFEEIDGPVGSARRVVAKSPGLADIGGRIAYRIDGDHVTVDIERIRNNTNSAPTGPLYVTMWLTRDEYPYSEGFQVARHQFDRILGPREEFSNIRRTLDYQEPPQGAYCVHFFTSQHPKPRIALDWHWRRNPDVLTVSHHEDSDSISRRLARVQEQYFQDCEACPLMVPVPEGSFSMGAPECEPFSQQSPDERPRRIVDVQPFAVGVYEVTFAEWDACVAGGGCNGYRPDDRDWGRERRPVIGVSWEDARSYVSWLSKRTKHRYRLPTEAEWEYAARAGTATPFHTGATISPQQANFNRAFRFDHPHFNTGELHRNQKTMPVGSFGRSLNMFGLYDVHGNISEWVEDCLGDYGEAPIDGRASSDCAYGPTKKAVRVLRGGSWMSPAWNLRSARRFGNPADYGRGDPTVGFRVVRANPTPPSR